MSRMMLLTARREPAPTPPPPDPPSWAVETGVPYIIPQTSPYNVPEPAITPTDDGSGSALHPDVIDFGPGGWNGWRYWMGYTPYLDNNDSVENPHIGVSADGFTWQWPLGVTNPLDPTPEQGWNADTDLVFVDGTLYLFWREWDMTVGHLRMRSTTDGVTWTPKANCLTGSAGYNLTSPAIVHDGTTWHMWTRSSATDGIVYQSAPAPDGPWTAPQPVVMSSATSFVPWHQDVILHDGQFWMVVYINQGPLRVASSTNGVNWSASEPVMTHTAGWQSVRLYRSTIQPHENGTHMRLWYSATGSLSNRIGYTHVAKSEWPAPPG